MAISPGDGFSKNDYFRQAEEVGDIISKNEHRGHNRVVEIGCGRGFNIRYLADRFPEENFFGFDLSSRNIESARKNVRNLPNVNVAIGNFQNERDFGETKSNLIFAVETLCHATDIEKALRAIAGSLADGGKFVIYDGFRKNQAEFDPVMQKALRYTEQAMAVPKFYELEQFVDMADKAGLEVVSVEDRSSEILPNLIRLSDLAKAFFKIPALSKLIMWVLPRGLVANAIAGLLMAVTVQSGAHRYGKIVFIKK